MQQCQQASSAALLYLGRPLPFPDMPLLNNPGCFAVLRLIHPFWTFKMALVDAERTLRNPRAHLLFLSAECGARCFQSMERPFLFRTSLFSRPPVGVELRSASFQIPNSWSFSDVAYCGYGLTWVGLRFEHSTTRKTYFDIKISVSKSTTAMGVDSHTRQTCRRHMTNEAGPL
jgi:hypothetical protein